MKRIYIDIDIDTLKKGKDQRKKIRMREANYSLH